MEQTAEATKKKKFLIKLVVVASAESALLSYILTTNKERYFDTRTIIECDFRDVPTSYSVTFLYETDLSEEETLHMFNSLSAANSESNITKYYTILPHEQTMGSS